MGGSLKDRIVSAVLEKAESGDELFLERRPIPGYISTTSLDIDDAIGQPGIPIGRITEISGWSGAGKSMLCCKLMASVQEMGGIPVLLDTERSYTKSWAENLGVDTSEVLDIVEELGVDSLESALRAIHVILDAVEESDETPVLMIVDSLSALSPETELEADYDDKQPGRHAVIMSKAMRKLTKEVFSKKVALVFVSQLREKLMSFGSGTSSLGGHAIHFHAALSLELKRQSSIVEDDQSIGINTKLVVKKNKLGGVPFLERVVKFYYDCGIDPVMSAFDVGVRTGLIENNRGWYSLKGGQKFRESQWRDVATEEVLQEIKDLVFPESGSV